MEKLNLMTWKRLALLGMISSTVMSCQDNDEIARLRAAIKEKEESLVDIDERIAKETGNLEKVQRLQETEQNNLSKRKEMEKLAEEVTAAKELTAQIGAKTNEASRNFINYRNQYRKVERTLAKGTFVDLSKTKGEDYKNVRISRITPIEMRIQLSSGPKGIRFQELPPEVQERFQFSEEEAAAYRAALIQAKKNLLAANKELTIKKEEELADKRPAEIAAEIDEKRLQIKSLTRRIKAKQLEAERLEDSARAQRARSNNDRARNRNMQHSTKAARLSDEANEIRLGISKAKEMIANLRTDIGRLLKED